MSKSKSDMGETQPIPVPHLSDRKSLQKAEALARDVLREKGFSDADMSGF
jgi:hypothetical protein